MRRDVAAELQDARHAQRQAAWERSAEVRRQSSALRRLMAERKVNALDAIAGTLPDADVAQEVERIIARKPVPWLVKSVPGIGAARQLEVLSLFGVSATTKVGQLSMAQRAELRDLCRAVL